MNISSEKVNAAKAWINDVLVWANPKSKNRRPEGYNYMYNSPHTADYEAGEKACQALVELFKNPDIEKAIASNYIFKTLSKFKFIPNLNSVDAKEAVMEMPRTLAEYFVIFTKMSNIFFDDTTADQLDLEEFILASFIGRAAAMYGDFVSGNYYNPNTGSVIIGDNNEEPVNDGGLRPATVADISRYGGGASGGGNRGMNRTYKDEGPQSSGLRNLRNPNKLLVDTKSRLVFKIALSAEAKRAWGIQKNLRIFVRPLSYNDNSRSVDANSNMTNKILCNSADNYKDMTCYFADAASADAFLVAVRDLFIRNGFKPKSLPKEVTVEEFVNALVVWSSRASGKGYFLIGTEVGDCLIAAERVNEDFNGREACSDIAKDKLEFMFTQEVKDEPVLEEEVKLTEEEKDKNRKLRKDYIHSCIYND